MNWTRLAAFTAIWLLLFFSAVRADRRARWVVVGLLTLPVAALMFLAALNNRYLPDLLVSAGVALAIGLVWWLAWGRRMPAPTSDSIRVWGQEVGAPSQKRAPTSDPAALQAEIARLQAEREQLEAEIRRLEAARARNNGHD